MDMHLNFVKLIFASALVDVLVEFIKVIFDGYFKTKNIKYKDIVLRTISIVIGLGLSVGYNLNMLYIIGLGTQEDLVGKIITGLFISRGANSLHDFLKKAGVNTKI